MQPKTVPDFRDEKGVSSRTVPHFRDEKGVIMEIDKETLQTAHKIDEQVTQQKYTQFKGITLKNFHILGDFKKEQVKLIGKILSSWGHNVVMTVDDEETDARKITTCYVTKKSVSLSWLPSRINSYSMPAWSY